MIKNLLIKNTACVLLCALLLTGGALSSCNGEQGEATEAVSESTVEKVPMLETSHELNENGLVDVVVLKEDVKKGQKIEAKLLSVIEVSPENLPRNIMSDKKQVYDKYALRDLYKGDYISSEWLVDDKSLIPNDHLLKNDIDIVGEDYVVVTDYVKVNTGEDLYIALQELIDKNPGRTLYFPDGEYIISQSLLTTSKPSDSTSFYLSAGAVLKAADYWESTGVRRALISLGAYEKVNDINTPGSNFFVMGGILDGNGIADGISIDAGRETLIKDVVIVNVRHGINIKEGTNNTSADTDIDDVTIVGNGIFNSVGITCAGDDNTISNVRILNVGTGMHLSNHAFVSSCTVENTMGSRNTVGIATGGNVHLSDCVSINYDIAFDLGDGSKGCAKQCTAIWTSSEGEKHIAFAVETLRTLLLGCRAEFFDGQSENIFLEAIDDGNGEVVGPAFDVSLVSDSDMTEFYLAKGSSILDLGDRKDEI